MRCSDRPRGSRDRRIEVADCRECPHLEPILDSCLLDDVEVHGGVVIFRAKPDVEPPEWCPLRAGDVAVTLRRQREEG